MKTKMPFKPEPKELYLLPNNADDIDAKLDQDISETEKLMEYLDEPIYPEHC